MVELVSKKWELRPVAELIEIGAHYNPRIISDITLGNLITLLKKFGPVLPCVVNKRTNRLVSGHQRVKAAKIAGIEQLPCVDVDLDEDREKALNLALNNIEGEWDYALLAERLDDSLADDLLELTGFSNKEALEVIASMEGIGEDLEDAHEKTFASQLSAVKSREFVRLTCGDSVKLMVPRRGYEELLTNLDNEAGSDQKKQENLFWEWMGLEGAGV